MDENAKTVEKSVETVWKSLWGNCGKVSTEDTWVNNLFVFWCKSGVFHEIVQKIYSVISPSLWGGFIEVGWRFYTFST